MFPRFLRSARAPRLAFAFLFGLAGSAVNLRAGDATKDWNNIVALDAGPSGHAQTQEQARDLAVEHLVRQEKALRAFIAAHPSDAHAFEASIRLSRALQIKADFEDSPTARAESTRLLDDAAKSAASPDQRKEVDFARISAFMRSLHKATPEQSEKLLTISRGFASNYPEDKRAASLLAEAAKLFDLQPEKKISLLAEAQNLAKDDELKAELADDLKKAKMVGAEVPLRFNTVEGKAVDIADYRGRVVLALFYASWSPPSMEAMAQVAHAASQVPKDRFQVLGIDLDSKPQTVTAVAAHFRVDWPIGFDGKGWEGPLVRSLGINSLPTAWLFDSKGRLRSLNALEGTEQQVKQLLEDK